MELRKMESLRVLEADGVEVGGLFSGTGVEEVRRGPWHTLMRLSYVPKPRRSNTSPEISWPSLVNLSLAGCNLSDEDFPREFSSLRKLRHLDLSWNRIVCLPHCFRGLSSLQYLDVGYCPSLRLLVGSLQLATLNLHGCKSLEEIIGISSRRRISIDVNYDNVAEIHDCYRLQPIPKMDVEMVKYLGLDLLYLKSMENVEVYTVREDLFVGLDGKRLIQEIYQYGIFSICLLGDEIPVCLDSMVKGSSITFTAPSNIPNSKIIGLNVCSVITLSGLKEIWYPPPLFTKIRNKRKGGKTWIYGPSYYGIPEEECKQMIWLSHWKFGDELEAGDEVDVCVVVGVGFRVVECGIKIVYQQEEEDYVEAAKGYNPFAGWTTVIGGDLSSLKKNGAYTLCNHRFRISPTQFDLTGVLQLVEFAKLYGFSRTGGWLFNLEGTEDDWCKQLFEQSGETPEEEEEEGLLMMAAD